MSDVAPALPADVTQPTGFIHTLLIMSLTAVAVPRPLYAEDGSTIRDFAWVSLNPAGQRMLSQPEHPSGSLLTLFPDGKEDGVFGVCCQAYATGELQRSQTNYQADGLDGYFLLVAQRYDNVLVVNFTDTNEQSRSAVEVALRSASAREQAARAEAERQRSQLHRLFQQAPAAICILSGPELVYELVNPDYQALFPGRVLLGRPILDALPEIAGNRVYGTFRQVYETGRSHEEQDLLIPLARPGDGVLEDRYFQYVQQARTNAAGQVDGVLVFAFEVTEQVRARQKAEKGERRLQLLTDALMLTVQDNGLGLDAPQQAQLFGLFRRLHTHVPGTGVGLYMVKRMVENAGGTSAVQRQPDLGTTFCIRLPA